MCRACYGRWRRTGDPQEVARAVLDRSVSPLVPEVWTSEIDSYLTYLRSGGASADVLRIRAHYLKHLAHTLPAGPWTATVDDLAAYLALAGDRWVPETRKSARAVATRGGRRTDTAGSQQASVGPARAGQPGPYARPREPHSRRGLTGSVGRQRHVWLWGARRAKHPPRRE